MSELYGRVVAAAYPHVKRLVSRPGVFLLAPPGSSRGYILERLLREGVVDGAYAYPRLAEELRARGLAVGDLPSAEELERGADRRVVVAVESSLQAVELKEKLGKRAKLIYLPKYFKEAAEDVDKKLLEAAEVEHRGLGEGISPKLLRPGDKELKKGRDALLALSPGVVGFRDVAREALGGLRFKIVSAFLAELLSPAFAVLAVLQAAAPSAAGHLLAFLEKAVETGREALGDFAARLLELFAGGREPRDKVAAGFAKLVRRALEAEPYIDDDRLEAVVDQVALEWGMDVKTFKALVKNLAALGRDRAAGLDLERLEEVVRREVEGVFKKVEDALREVKTQVSGLLAGVKVAFVGDVEAGLLYHNFVVVGGVPRVKTRVAGRQGDVVVDVVAGGVFGRLAGEVLERLERDGLVVLVGPHGVGKSTLAAYVAWLALWRGAADAVVSAGEVKTGLASALENLQKNTGRRFLLLYDPVPVTAYYEPHAVRAEVKRDGEETWLAVEEALSAAKRGVMALVVLPDELYRGLPPKAKETLEKYVVKAVLKDVEFLHKVVMRYSSCGGDYSKLAEKIAQFNDGYTLVAKYAGLWLRGRGCDAGDVEKAVEEAKQEPKLFLANYIWHVLLRGSGDLARKVAVPLLLHAHFGPVPVGVTYITKAVNDGVWRFLKPEELEGAGLESLREDVLEPIANWLAKWHEDLIEETLRDLAGLNGEGVRDPYKKASSDLIKALNWARDEALKEGNKILAEFGIPMETLKVHSEILTELGVPEVDWELWTALLAFVNQRLAAVFKSGESRRCWKRAAFIAGHALAGYLVLLTTKPPEHVAETLGDALKPCVVDDYLTIDGEIPWLSIGVAQLMPIRELNTLSPYTDVEIIKAAGKIAEELMKQWRRRGFSMTEVIYVLGLATLAAGAEVDGETADRLLYAASATVQLVTHPVAVLPVLAALRPLGDKAPHRYIVALAAASELETLDHETVEYIYDALQQLRDCLIEAERRWPLVKAVHAYSNLVRKHLMSIKHLQKNAVANMCQLYGEVRKRNAAVAPESGLSAHRLFDAIARACVLAVALESDDLVRHVRKHCGLGDLEREAETVRNVLDDATAHPEELRKIMENDADFAEWVTARNVTGDAGLLIEDLRAWLTYELASYRLDHAIDEKGELDAEKLEEVAEEFEKAAEMHRKLKLWENYLTARGWALRTRVLAAKSWEELLERAKGFWELWREAEKYFKPTTGYFMAANLTLGQCLVYLAVSGNKAETVKLLKEWQWLLDYDPEVSVVTWLMLKLFGVGKGARLKDVVDVFGPWLPPEFWPTLLMLTGRLQKEETLELCKKLPKSEVCVNAVVSVAGDQEAAEKSKLEIKSEIPEACPLRNEVDGRTLVEVLATTYSHARLAFMLLAAVEGRADAVRLHGLLGSVTYVGNMNQPLFRAVYENCGELNSEGCRLALLKLYYYHY
ncbi:MAG: hypothetical protein ACO2PM_20235 [Pyrobaculum sp.]